MSRGGPYRENAKPKGKRWGATWRARLAVRWRRTWARHALLRMAIATLALVEEVSERCGYDSWDP
jgi:hypothetical protein